MEWTKDDLRISRGQSKLYRIVSRSPKGIMVVKSYDPDTKLFRVGFSSIVNETGTQISFRKQTQAQEALNKIMEATVINTGRRNINTDTLFIYHGRGTTPHDFVLINTNIGFCYISSDAYQRLWIKYAEKNIFIDQEFILDLFPELKELSADQINLWSWDWTLKNYYVKSHPNLGLVTSAKTDDEAKEVWKEKITPIYEDDKVFKQKLQEVINIKTNFVNKIRNFFNTWNRKWSGMDEKIDRQEIKSLSDSQQQVIFDYLKAVSTELFDIEPIFERYQRGATWKDGWLNQFSKFVEDMQFRLLDFRSHIRDVTTYNDNGRVNFTIQRGLETWYTNVVVQCFGYIDRIPKEITSFEILCLYDYNTGTDSDNELYELYKVFQYMLRDIKAWTEDDDDEDQITKSDFVNLTEETFRTWVEINTAESNEFIYGPKSILDKLEDEIIGKELEQYLNRLTHNSTWSYDDVTDFLNQQLKENLDVNSYPPFPYMDPSDITWTRPFDDLNKFNPYHRDVNYGAFRKGERQSILVPQQITDKMDYLELYNKWFKRSISLKAILNIPHLSISQFLSANRSKYDLNISVINSLIDLYKDKKQTNSTITPNLSKFKKKS